MGPDGIKCTDGQAAREWFGRSPVRAGAGILGTESEGIMSNPWIRRIALLLAAVGAIGGAFAVQKWLATQANFDRAVRALWEESQSGRSGPRQACVWIPYQPWPDASSIAQAPLAWHKDFRTDTPRSSERETQLRQLDALAKVGLLERTNVTLAVDGDWKPAHRYRLTDAGWASSVSNRGRECLRYGTPEYLGVQRFVRHAISAEAGVDVYEVTAKTGIPSQQLAPWARDPEVQAAFPEIRENLVGKDMVLLMARGSGGWVSYSTLRRERILARAGVGQAGMLLLGALAESEREQERSAARGLKPATQEEVKALLRAEYGPSADPVWPAPCVTLPGSEKLPVDMRLSTYSPLHYAVAVFRDKERTPHDRVLPKTQPYLERLVALGVLVKRLDPGVRDGKKGSTALHEADVYELASAYARDLKPDDPHCLWLGAPSLRFVDISIGDAAYARRSTGTVSYRLRITYPAAPIWMKDARLLGEWPELRGAIENGYACSGSFGFNMVSRQRSAGSGGSCWWAYDDESEDGGR